MMRAVKKPDGTIAYKQVAELDKATESKKGQKSDKAWVKEKAREVAKARDAEFHETKRKEQRKNANTYGASEIYTRRSDRQGQVHVEVSQYLADLRLEDEQARHAQKDTKQPGQYRLIKEALDAEESKYQQKVLKAREVSYSRTRKRMGVRGGGKQGDSTDEEDNAELSDEQFRKLCQARNDSANKELAMSGAKLLKPVKAEAVPGKKAQSPKAAASASAPARSDRNTQKRELYNPGPSNVYVDPRSAAAQEQAAAEADHWASLKQESEISAQHREQGTVEGRPSSGRNSRNNRKQGKGKGGAKGGNSAKGGGNKGSGKGNSKGSNRSGKGRGRGSRPNHSEKSTDK